MAIKNIDQLFLYTYLEPVYLEGLATPARFPMIALMDGSSLIAAIKIGLGDAWHVENVCAVNGYGPTIYKALMEVSEKNGIAPAYKIGKEEKDFVVPKCKEIWKVFSCSLNVEACFLEEKYSEKYLNLKFVSILGELDIKGAEKNLLKYMKNECAKRMNLFEKLKALIYKNYKDQRFKKFRYEYENAICRCVHDFLNPSAEIHRE